MPNWIENRMTVLGPIADVAAFVAKARGVVQHYAPHPYDVEHEKHQREKAEARGETWVPYADRVYDLSWHQIVPIPDEVLAGRYDPGGYNAEANLWGIKWGASDTKLETHETVGDEARATYRYTTPWGPGEKWHQTASKAWPTLTFAVSWGGEYPSRGRYALRNGVLLGKIEGEDWDAPELADDATEEAERAHHDQDVAWREHYVTTHAQWIQGDAVTWRTP